jgi:hypothetical protein
VPITYPLTPPPGIQRVRITHQHATAFLRSPWTFSAQTQEHPGKIFTAEVTVAPCRWAEGAAAWAAFLAKLKGPVGTFYLGNKLAPRRGVATGTPQVNGSVAARSETITTKGWTNSTTNILREGDYIQIGTRLYQVMLDANSDGSGNATLDVFPPVREALVNNTAIVITNPVGLFRLDTAQVTPYEVDADEIYSIAFTAVEAV